MSIIAHYDTMARLFVVLVLMSAVAIILMHGSLP
jgi:hypothetical protein